MVRLHIHLTAAQVERLKELSAQRGVSRAALIRQAIDQWLATDGSVSRAQRRQRALVVAGQFRSAVADLAEAHDRHLAEAYDA